MAFKQLFLLEDKIMGTPGLYLMWTILFVANFTAMLLDNTQGTIRNFSVCTNVISVIYLAVGNLNNIYGNKLPSTMLLIAGPVHQYSYWLLFAYYGGSDVLSSHPIGIMNWISLFVLGIFTADMVVKTWICSFKPNLYIEYVNREIEATKPVNNA